VRPFQIVNSARVDGSLVDAWKARAGSAVRNWNIDPQRLVDEEWIAEWRLAMKRMGVNAAKTRSSRRVRPQES
jgi:DNA/RNA-binding domain of Phe-tRNA-synthetase-like protein